MSENNQLNQKEFTLEERREIQQKLHQIIPNYAPPENPLSFAEITKLLEESENEGGGHTKH